MVWATPLAAPRLPFVVFSRLPSQLWFFPGSTITRPYLLRPNLGFGDMSFGILIVVSHENLPILPRAVASCSSFFLFSVSMASLILSCIKKSGNEPKLRWSLYVHLGPHSSRGWVHEIKLQAVGGAVSVGKWVFVTTIAIRFVSTRYGGYFHG